MADICDVNPRDPAPSDDSEVSFVPMAAVDEVTGAITAAQTRRVAEVRKGFTPFADGDVIFAKITPCMENGKAAIASALVNGRGYGSTEFFVLRGRGVVLPEFVHRFVRQESYRQAARATMKSGVGQARVPRDFIESTRIPHPPLNEQRPLLAKLEARQARSRRAREALDAVPPLLEKLRQSILAAAFRGDLTKDWRAKHKDVEPASELLKRIRTERRKKWEESELAKMKAKGKTPTDDKWKAKYKDPAPVDTTGLPELPAGWCWASLDELIVRIDAGRSPKAHGRPATSAEQGVLKVSAVSWEEFDAAENKALLEGEEIGDTPTVRAGDLLISRANTVQLVGAVVLAQQDHPNLMLSDKTLRVVPASSAFPLELLLHALRTREVRAVFEDDATGTSDSMRNLSQEKIRAAPIALPPAAEAAVVVTLLSAATRARRRIDRQRGELVSNMNQLERATLAKAFRGELVPQNPNDEPAEAMLARVRGANGAHAGKAEPAPQKRRGRSSRQELR